MQQPAVGQHVVVGTPAVPVAQHRVPAQQGVIGQQMGWTSGRLT
jgi:hypothetical protein